VTAGSVTTPATSVLVEVPPGTIVTVAPTAPLSAPSPLTPSSPTPPAPSLAPTGTGNPLAPVVTIVAEAVTSVGNIVSASSSGLGNTVPVRAPVTTVVGNWESAVSGLGQSPGATVARQRAGNGTGATLLNKSRGRAVISQSQTTVWG
jgi:hypothetical protein